MHTMSYKLTIPCMTSFRSDGVARISKVLKSVRAFRPRKMPVYGNKPHSLAKNYPNLQRWKEGPLISWKQFDLTLNDYCKQKDIPKYQVKCCILYNVKQFVHTVTHTYESCEEEKTISEHDKSEMLYMTWDMASYMISSTISYLQVSNIYFY